MIECSFCGFYRKGSWINCCTKCKQWYDYNCDYGLADGLGLFSTVTDFGLMSDNERLEFCYTLGYKAYTFDGRVIV